MKHVFNNRDFDLMVISRGAFRKKLDDLIWSNPLIKKLEPFGLDGEIFAKILLNYHGLRLSGCKPAKNDPLEQFRTILFDTVSGQIHVIERYPVRGISDNQGFNAMKAEKEVYYFDGEEIDPATLSELRALLGKFDNFNYDPQRRKHSFIQKFDQTRRRAAPMLKDPLMPDRVKKITRALISDLQLAVTAQADIPDRPLHFNELKATPQAKTITQMFGFQVFQLFESIWPIAKALNDTIIDLKTCITQNQVFEFISDLLNLGLSGAPHSGRDVKKMYENILERDEVPKKM